MRYWVPVLVWAAMISVASTQSFGAEHTSHVILPFLRWLMPHAGRETLVVIHHLIRKGGHVFEYAVLSLLVVYGFRAGRKQWRWEWAGWTLLIVACYAGLDEVHQAFVPGRGSSIWDAGLDTLAGATALVMAWMFFSWRAKKADAKIKSNA